MAKKKLKPKLPKLLKCSKHERFVATLSVNQQQGLAKLLAKVLTKVEKAKFKGNKFPKTVAEQMREDCAEAGRKEANRHISWCGWRIDKE